MKAMLLCLVTVLAGLSAGAVQADEAWRTPLRDGFDGRDFAPEGGLYYRENSEQAAGKVEFQSAVKRDGAGALKLSVRPLCSDREENCSERAEIWEKTKLRAPYDQPMWFGFAVKFADPIPSDDHRYLIAQWKREIGPEAEGDFSPFLAFRLERGKLAITVESNYQPGDTRADPNNACDAGKTPVWLRPDTRQMRSFIVADDRWAGSDYAEFPSCTDKLTVTTHGHALPRPESGWIDFAVLSRPGPDGKGHIEIFANGDWIATVKGFIGHNDFGLGHNQYFKFGPYRAAAKDDWALYYDDFRRSPDCMDVLADAKACAAMK